MWFRFKKPCCLTACRSSTCVCLLVMKYCSGNNRSSRTTNIVAKSLRLAARGQTSFGTKGECQPSHYLSVTRTRQKAVCTTPQKQTPKNLMTGLKSRTKESGTGFDERIENCANGFHLVGGQRCTLSHRLRHDAMPEHIEWRTVNLCHRSVVRFDRGSPMSSWVRKVLDIRNCLTGRNEVNRNSQSGYPVGHWYLRKSVIVISSRYDALIIMP